MTYDEDLSRYRAWCVSQRTYCTSLEGSMFMFDDNELTVEQSHDCPHWLG